MTYTLHESYEGISVEVLGPAMQKLRKAWSINREEMAEAMGISLRLITKLEYGEKSSITLEQLHRALPMFNHGDYTVESLADLVKKSNEPESEQHRNAREARQQAQVSARSSALQKKHQNTRSLAGKGFFEDEVAETFQATMGRVMRMLREEKKVSREQVAGRLNILPDSLSRFERGMVPLSKDQIEETAAALNISMHTVFEKLCNARGASRRNTAAREKVRNDMQD
jgi:transcriptional regulator with XRE-family HTH domain